MSRKDTVDTSYSDFFENNVIFFCENMIYTPKKIKKNKSRANYRINPVILPGSLGALKSDYLV